LAERIPLEDEFGDIIAKARFGLKRSTAHVALSAGVAEGALRSLEGYERQPSDREVAGIATALGLNADRLAAVVNGSWRPEDEPMDGDAQSQVVRLLNYVGGYPVFSYLLACRRTKQAVAIDTAADGEQVLREAQQRGLALQAVLLTHGHGDHVEDVAMVQERAGIPVVMGPTLPIPSGVQSMERIGDGETYSVGDVSIELRRTPGHTPDCVTYVSGKVAISGDVLFAGSLGRANFSYDAIRESVRTRLFTLSDDTRIYPGHGPSTTVGEEKAHNPFF